MATEMQRRMYHAESKNIRVLCTNGKTIAGRCEQYTQPLDNEPEVASICIRQSGNNTSLTEVTEEEIETIEYID